MSDINSFGVIDYCVFIGMLLISTFIGIYYAWTDRKKQTNEEFLMGGKSMGIMPVAMSLMASFMSSITILGFPVEIYTKGTQFWMFFISCFIAAIVAAEIFLPIFYKMNLTSVNKYLHKRYDSNIVRFVASISILLSSFPYMGIELFGPSLALGAVTKLSVTSSVIYMGIICTFYTTIGGLKAVIWTDVVQFVLIFVGMIAVVVKGTIDAGGLHESLRKADMGHRIQFFNMDFDIYSSNTFWSVVIGTSIMWTGSYSTNQMQVQRSCSMPDIKKAKKALYISMPGLIIMLSLACYAGVVAFANYYDCDPMKTGQLERPDQLMPYFVLQSFGNRFPGIPGLFVACVFSSSLSTLSSSYNALAAIAWDDFLKKFFRDSSDIKAVWITKLVAALIGLLSIGVAFLASRVGTIFEAAIALSGAQIGPLFAIFVIGVFFPFGNAFGAVTGLLSGQISCLVITIGAIVHKRPYGILPTSTEGCDINIYPNSTSLGVPLELLKNSSIPHYSPEGLNTIYHISPYLVPFFGFIISLIVGLVISLITGGNRQKFIDPDLVNAKALKIYRLIVNNNKHESLKQNSNKQQTFSETIPMTKIKT